MQIQTDVLGGLLFINEKDVYKRFGAFLSEERAGTIKIHGRFLSRAGWGKTAECTYARI